MYSIDVVIPCYYAPEIIQPCFEKLAAQTYRCFKVIMINDCSPFTNDEYASLRQHYSQLMDLRYYKTDKNSGPGVVRQFGLDVADSDFIMFIDDDDELYDEFALENLVRKINFTNKDQVLFSSGQSLHRWDDGRTELVEPNFHHHGSIYNLSLLKKHNAHYEKDLSYKEEDCAFSSLLCSIMVRYGYQDIKVNRPVYIKKWSSNHKSLTASVSIIDSFIALMSAKRYEMSYATHKNETDEEAVIVAITFANLVRYLVNNNLYLTKEQYQRIGNCINDFNQKVKDLNINFQEITITGTLYNFLNSFFTENIFYGKWYEEDIYLFPLAYKHNLSFLAQQIRD